MGAHSEFIKLAIAMEPKIFYYDLPKDVDNNLALKIDSIRKHNEL